jgi:RHS repeat-associated protein
MKVAENYLSNSLFSNIKNLAVCVSLILFANQFFYSQVPLTARNNKSTINVSDFEQINLKDGTFSFNLPLVSLGGRGVSNGVSLNLESKWRSDNVITGYSGATPHITNIVQPDPYALTGVFPQKGGYLLLGMNSINTSEVGQCSNETVYRSAEKEISVNFVGFGGQSFEFVSEVNDGDTVLFSDPQCWSNRTFSLGTTFYAVDGSGTKFIADQPVIINDELESNPMVDLSGVVNFPDGSKYGIVGGLVAWTQDRNGNKTYLTNTGFQVDPRQNRVSSVKDALNREVQVTGNQNSQTITYKGFGGATRTIKVNYCDTTDPCLRADQSLQMLHTLFPMIVYPNHPSNRLTGGGVIKDIELPDGRKYKFFYNSYTELARVELPTGGAVEYDYETVSQYSLTRRIIERRVYSNGVNLDSKIQYSYSDYPLMLPGTTIPVALGTTEKLFDNQNSLKLLTKHYFVGCIPDSGTNCYYPTGYEPPNAHVYFSGHKTRTEIFAGDGTTLLRKTDIEYELNGKLNWRSGNGPYKFFRPKKTTTTLADSNQVSKVEYGYDTTVPYNLQTDVYEYDYGSGAPGSLIRRTHTDFQKSSTYTGDSVHLLNLPLETWISSDAGGSAKVSRVQYEYDNYTSDTYHAPLVNRSNITGHNSNYGTSYTTRGNVTRLTSYADAQNQAGAVSVHSQYDIAGNVVKVFDGKGYASISSYSDNFGSPDAEARTNSSASIPNLSGGQQAFAFVTSLTNVANYTTYAQFDYYSGSAVDAEDIIGNVDTTFYNDVLDRPTQTISANNRSAFRKQTTVAYDDANRKVTITVDSQTFGDNLNKTESFYDGLGRTTESRQYESGSNYITTIQEYDALGRAYKSSNLYRPYLNEQPQWTTTSFDALGRVTQVKAPDNSVVTRQYYGTSTRVYDQTNRSRSAVSDAMGRLVKVVEHDNGTDLETLYTYDVLGRLRKTLQGAQSRYFMYDDLGRLIRSKQTEETANSVFTIGDPVTGNSSWSAAYSYDNNGNLTWTADSRGVATTGTYDNLNRLTFRNYSDSTPDVTFTFDNVNIPNSKGKLTAISSSVSTTDYLSFDELGRIKSSSQTINGQTYSFPDYTYDLSGALVSQTYPSGRIVRHTTDNIGRLSKVTSQLPNQFEKVYLSQLSYTAFGAVSQAKLGNGRWESTQYDDKRLQITQIGLGGSAGDTSLLKLEYNYGTTTSTTSDNNGSLRQQKITVPGISNQITQNYTYDHLNRLESAVETVAGNSTPSWKQTFTYDRYGNRRFDAGNTTTLPANNAVYNPNIDTDNKFLVSEGYNYDSEGNLTSNPENQLFAYNAENKQIQIQNTATNIIVDYYYDGGGKRVKKIIGDQETIYVYDAFGKLVAEYTTEQAVTTEGTKYLTADALGSPRAITNARGQVVSRHDYMPFGEEVASGIGGRTSTQGYLTNSSGIRQDGIDQQFTGYERDLESGLDFAQNRYFASKHGRFTSVDPLAASANIKNPQTLNRYSYGLNSPYKFTDPLGLAPTQHCWAGICNTYDADEQDHRGRASERESSEERRRKGGQDARVVEIFEMIANGENVDDWLSLPETVRNYRREGAVTVSAEVDSLETSPLPQTADAPSFKTLWESYPETEYLILDKGSDGKLKYQNQCAIRMSETFIKSGYRLRGFKYYADGNYPQYALRALEMREFYTRLYGQPIEITDKDAISKLKGKKGIVVIERFLGSNGKDWYNHTDLWDGNGFRGGDAAWMNRRKTKVYFWEVK